MSKPSVIANRFEVEVLIGHGGMGDVYRGRDTLTGQPVAIKFLKPEIIAENPELVARFVREGEALRALNHPNIVKMLAAADDDGHRCLIMEYVGGGSLRDLLTRQPRLPVDRVLNIALDLADALTRAHRLKIIHRDIKPANVLLAEDGTPRLTDFGVAHLSDRTRVTETGMLIGTYAYISPEACMGDELDARTDIWSFGVLLFEMLAGQRPFEATHPAAIITAILTKPVPDLLALRPDAPPALVGLIYAMLEKDRDKRIASVRLVGAQLEAIIGGTPTGSPFAATPPPLLVTPVTPTPTVPPIEDAPTIAPTPTPLRSSSHGQAADAPPRRSRWRWLAALAALALAAVLIAPGLLPGAVPPPTAAPATTTPAGALPTDDAAGKVSVPTALPVVIEPVQPGEFMVLVADFEPINTLRRDVTRFIVRDLRRKLEEAVPFSQVRVRELPQVIHTDEEAQAAAEAAGATVIIWGNYTRSQIEAEVQIGSTVAFPALAFDRLTLERTANITLRLTDPRDESLVNPALGVITILQLADGNGYEVMRTLAVLDQINAATPEMDGGGIAARAHQFIAAYVDDTPAAVDAISAAITLDPANALLYAARAAARQRLGRLDESRQDVRTAERSGPADWAIPLFLEANIPLMQNDVDAAIPLYDQIIALRPDDWFPYSMRGAFYYQQDDLARAKQDYARSIELKPNANFPYVISGMIALREGRMADARRHMETILREFTDPLFASRISTVAFGDQSKSPFGAVFAAFGYLILDQYDQMLQAAQTAVQLDGTLSDLYAIEGYAYCNLGRYQEAEAAYTRGIEMKPNAPIGYALRAEVRLKQLNVLGGNADARRAMQLINESGRGKELQPYITAGLLQQVGCTNFWDWQPPQP
ncbi:MAG: protein kinase [Chloroflexi bacterium]|nr:protein kinase [Chloroflexota bacterium]